MKQITASSFPGGMLFSARSQGRKLKLIQETLGKEKTQRKKDHARAEEAQIHENEDKGMKEERKENPCHPGPTKKKKETDEKLERNH